MAEDQKKPGGSRKGKIAAIAAGLVVVAVLAIVFLRGDQLEEVLHYIEKGSPIFIAFAVASQLCKYIMQGIGYKVSFKAVDANMPYPASLGLVFATFFMSTIAPSFNVSSTTLVAAVGDERHIPIGRGTAAGLLMQICINAGFLVVMLVAFAYLLCIGHLQLGWLLLGAIAFLLVAMMVAFMVFSGKRPDLVKRLAHPILKPINWVLSRFHKGPVTKQVDDAIASFSKSDAEISRNGKLAALDVLISVCASSFELGCFCLVGFAFGIENIEMLACGYVVATLSAMISIVPQGVGIVEAAVMVVIGLFHVNAAAGIATIMVYRAIVFWVPLVIGAIVMQRMGAKAGSA